jgi:hypothetical protein
MKTAVTFLLITVPLVAAQRGALTLENVQTVDAHTPRELQIRLAESAAPPAIASGASIYVLGPNGYELARAGKNGFTCLVSRQLVNTMEPECYDAEGTATTLKARFFVEEQRSKGVNEEQIASAVELGYKKKRFIAPRRPGIVYMMSDHNFVFDPEEKKVIRFPGHIMFYAPYLTAKDVGEGPGAPYLTHPGAPDNVMVVVPRAHTARE